jgi:hypothetical protein
MLRDAGWSINRFEFGAKARNHAIYKDRAVEIWKNLSMQIDKREIVLINDPALISQLTTRKIFYDLKGRLRLESKDDLRARGVKSPDRADAVAGAFAHGSPSFATYTRQRESPFTQLDAYWDGFDAEQSQVGDGQAEKIQKQLGSWTG